MNEEEFKNFDSEISIEESDGETIDEIAEAVAQEHLLNEHGSSSGSVQPAQEMNTIDVGEDDQDLPYISKFNIP